MAHSHFEILPNELILNVFSYLSTIDRCFAFYNLNNRFNEILKSDTINIDLTNCRRSRFIFGCQHILARIQKPFALKLTRMQLDRSIYKFFIRLRSRHLDNLLESITLINVTSQATQDVIQHLNGFSNLRSLIIIYDSLESAHHSLETVMNANLTSLTYLKIKCIGRLSWCSWIDNVTESYSTMLSIQLLILRVPIYMTEFRRLLHFLPQIRSIEVSLMGKWQETNTNISNIHHCASKLKKLMLTLSSENGTPVGFESISQLLQEHPQLQTFWCTAFFCDNCHGKQYQDGQIWENLIRTYLPNLSDFRLNIGVERDYPKSHPDSLIESFCSPFWTEEKKWWFVADLSESNADAIELYSLPPPKSSKIIFSPYIRWASNSTSPNFASIRTLGLISSWKFSLFSLKCTVNNPRHYTNVTTILPPHGFDDMYLTYVSILPNHIDLTNVENLTVACGNLTEILPNMTNLNTLTIEDSCNIVQYLSKIPPMPKLKRLSLARPYPLSDGYNQADLSMIKQLFPNIEYLQVTISDIKDLPDFINGMSHLIHITINYHQNVRKWIESYMKVNKFKWNLEGDKMHIWLF